MEKRELIEKINAALADEFEVDESVITPEAPIKETLELDSLSLVDLLHSSSQTSASKSREPKCPISRPSPLSTISSLTA